jgi:hypothetical protein
MRRPIRRPVRRTAATAATLLALVSLSGCFKLDMDMEVNSDETIDGAVIVAVDKELADMAGAESEDSDLTEEDVPEGATIEEYDEDGFVGQKVTFDGVSMDELNTSFTEEDESGGPSSWSLTHEGGEYRFTGDMDLTEMAAEEDGLDMGAFMSGAELRIAMTFPGEVTESNGEVDGNTVVWEPEIGEANEMTAVAEEGSGLSAGLVAIIAGVAVALLLVVAGAFLVLRRRRGAAARPEQPMAAPSGGPAPPTNVG